MNKYIHYGHDKFNINLFKKIKNRPFLNKPDGGFWASGKHYKYSWKAWCEVENFSLGSFEKFFEFELKENSNILTIDNLDKAIKFNNNKYPIFNKWIDFERLSQNYDGIEILISKDPNLYYYFHGWDCDSILIMNPDIIGS